MTTRNNFERPIYVVLTCNGEQIDENDIPMGDWLNIAEDMQGRDVVTFKCPECGQDHESFRLG